MLTNQARIWSLSGLRFCGSLRSSRVLKSELFSVYIALYCTLFVGAWPISWLEDDVVWSADGNFVVMLVVSAGNHR